MSNWTQDLPTSQGWYFWRKRRNTRDPWKWYAYYILHERNVPMIGEIISCWSDGTEVHWPTGGWWFAIEETTP